MNVNSVIFGLVLMRPVLSRSKYTNVLKLIILCLTEDHCNGLTESLDGCNVLMCYGVVSELIRTRLLKHSTECQCQYRRPAS